MQHGDEVAVEEDPVVVKKVVKIARTQSEKVLTAAAEPWKPGNIQHGEEVKVEEDEVVTKAVVKLQKKFSERCSRARPTRGRSEGRRDVRL